MPSVSSGWHSLTAAAQLQSSQFCHHSPQSILKISRFQNTSLLFFVQCINAKQPPSQLHPHPPPNSYLLSLLMEKKILCTRCSRYTELRKMNRNFLPKSTVVFKFFCQFMAISINLPVICNWTWKYCLLSFRTLDYNHSCQKFLLFEMETKPCYTLQQSVVWLNVRHSWLDIEAVVYRTA